MLTVGGVVSGGGALLTFTVTAAEVVRLPAASRAVAVRVWEPLLVLAVFQETEYGEVVRSEERRVGKERSWTSATPTLSEALALTGVVADTVARAEGDVMLTVGGVVSGGGALETVTVTPAEVVRLPAASRAVAVRVCEPLPVLAVFQETEYGEVVSSAPKAAPSSRNWTPATPTLSEAVALTAVVPERAEEQACEVLLKGGGVWSGG